jgi:hypothetical protein
MHYVIQKSEFSKVKLLLGLSLILFSASAIVTFSGAASAADTSKEVNAPDSVYDANLNQQDAQLASLKGDWVSEVALAGKAYREDPSLLNEFNLATGYKQLGRTVLAIPLYQDLALRGQYIHIDAVYNYDSALYAGVRARHMNSTLSDESVRRLNQIAGRPAPFNR